MLIKALLVIEILCLVAESARAAAVYQYGDVTNFYQWPNYPSTKPKNKNCKVAKSNKNGINMTEINLGCPLRMLYDQKSDSKKLRITECFNLLHPTVKNDYEQCLEPESCWTFRSGECGMVPESPYEKNKDLVKDFGAYADAKETFYDNRERVVTVTETFQVKSVAGANALYKLKTGNARNPAVVTFQSGKLISRVQCCLLRKDVKVGACQKIRMSKEDLVKYRLESVTTSQIVRTIPRGSFTADPEAMNQTKKVDKPWNYDVLFWFDVEVCQIQSVGNAKCPLRPASPDQPDLSDIYDTGCKKGLCAAGSKCDPEATSPETMCIKCDEEGCNPVTPKATPGLVDCGELGQCAIPPGYNDSAVSCNPTADPKNPCVYCEEWDPVNGNCSNWDHDGDRTDDEGDEIKGKGNFTDPVPHEYSTPIDFPPARVDVPCPVGVDPSGYCPEGSVCNADATSVDDMCLRDGVPVGANKVPGGVPCLGGMCPKGSTCNSETATGPDDLCTPGPPIFPPGVDCPGGRCPLGSVCNPAATSPENMCVDKDGNFVNATKVNEGVPCNGGMCPKGSTCSEGACQEGAFECASMCTGPDGGIVAPIFPGGVSCLGGLCPAGTDCNENASSEKDMCLSKTGKPVAPIRPAQGVPCSNGLSCPAGSTCNKLERDPKKMCTKDGKPVSPFYTGDVTCPNGIVCPSGSKCNPGATSKGDACVMPGGRLVGARSVPTDGVPCNGGLCPAGSTCVEGTAPVCIDPKTGRRVSPILWGKPGGGGDGGRDGGLACPGGGEFSPVESPGPSPWVFKGYHQLVADASSEAVCKTKCKDDKSCGQAVFTGSNKCYHHIVEKGDDICESKHSGEIEYSCNEGSNSCKFHNKKCKECKAELKLMGKVAFCQGSKKQELLQFGKNMCPEISDQDLAKVFPQ